MIAVDTNVLVYAHRREAREHRIAFELMASLASGRSVWSIPWPCVYEFFSVVTNVRIWRSNATEPERAWQQIRAWLGAPTLRLLGETEGFASVLGPLLGHPRVRGGVVHDARIAALCIAHGVEKLVTRDRDFALFPQLLTENPFS